MDTGEPMGTGEPMDPKQAEEALAAARSARCAAQKAGDERHRPLGYAIGQGLASAVGFSALGLADRQPQWAPWLAGVGVLSLLVFLALIWAGVHHTGTVRWFGRDSGCDRPRWQAWVLPLTPVAIGLLGYAFYGAAGWLVAFGVSEGAGRVLTAALAGRVASTA
ncbi:hypothetical protein [Streptomyces sp. NPDC127190]|uniref:hypothetical protein n=1 Tax=unclassified Streptomyces TaxID=2593676 RepID=UPI003642E014